jgi:hypothetical protein
MVWFSAVLPNRIVPKTFPPLHLLYPIFQLTLSYIAAYVHCLILRDYRLKIRLINLEWGLFAVIDLELSYVLAN